MKRKVPALQSIVIIVILFIVGVSAAYLSGKKDSPVEQLAEAALRTQGIDLDFSPEYNECQ